MDEDPDQDQPRAPTDRNEDLSTKLTRLTEEQHARYQIFVQNAIDRDNEAQDQFRHKIADTLLKNLPGHEEAYEIREHNRQHQQNILVRDERLLATRPDRQQQASAQPPRNDPGPGIPADSHATNPMEGVKPSGRADYSELQRTHDQVAQHIKQTGPQQATQPPAPSAEPAATLFSKEQLNLMLQQFTDIRFEANIRIGPAEIRERDELTQAQNTDRQLLERHSASEPAQLRNKKLDLMDHQHLAEQAGVQSKWISRHLEAQHAPDAKNYSDDAKRAISTAHHLHDERQSLGTSINLSPEVRHARDNSPAPARTADEASRSGKNHTSDDRAKASPDTRTASDTRDRASAARELTSSGKESSDRQGPTPTGTSRGGGRSR